MTEISYYVDGECKIYCYTFEGRFLSSAYLHETPKPLILLLKLLLKSLFYFHKRD